MVKKKEEIKLSGAQVMEIKQLLFKMMALLVEITGQPPEEILKEVTVYCDGKITKCS